MGTPAVEVRELVKKYDGRDPVLCGVTFTLRAGEFVTLFGKSGCGKTTLLNMIGGLDQPSSGDIIITGDSIIGLSEDELARIRLDRIGFVFQDYNLLHGITVRENIALPLRFSHRHVQMGVDYLIEEFDIKSIADITPNRISGGEAQRVAIARALVNEPKIILADEPTGNLDSDNTANVIEAFKLATKVFGATVLLATHDKDLTSYSSSVLYLDSGKVSVAPQI